MKIAIDISQIVYVTGVSHYTRKLVESLLKLDQENEYLLFAGTLRRRADIFGFIDGLTGNFDFRLLPVSPQLADLFWNRLRLLSIESFIGRTDILHTSDWTEPRSKAFKVTTIHDLSPILFPTLTHPRISSVHRRKLALAKKEAEVIIAPSLSTKEDLVGLGFGKERVVVIPEASVYQKTSQEQVMAVKRKYKINSDYVLSVGVNPRKNTKGIIKGFELAKAGKNIKLVLVGRPSFEKVEEKRGVRLLGEVPQEEMASLYTGAKALVYPSFYEGFGLPILDAFACDTPVVTSNISSMKEVAGEAAILVDPNDPVSIADGIKKALNNQKGLKEKGRKRVKGFSWEKTAQEVLAVYKRYQEK